MSSVDPRLDAVLQAASGRLQVAASEAAGRLVTTLADRIMNAASNRQRELLVSAQFQLRRMQGAFNMTFSQALVDEVRRELEPKRRSGFGPTDWQSLSLVDDAQVEAMVSSERLSQTLGEDCEWELRELDTYTGALLRVGRADKDRNPLRPEVLGRVLRRATEAVTTEVEVQKFIAGEIARLMSRSMAGCYRGIIADLAARGVRPVGMSVRSVEGPGTDYMRSGYDSRFGPTTSSFDETLGLPGETSPLIYGTPADRHLEPSGGGRGGVGGSRGGGSSSGGGSSGGGSGVRGGGGGGGGSAAHAGDEGGRTSAGSSTGGHGSAGKGSSSALGGGAAAGGAGYGPSVAPGARSSGADMRSPQGERSAGVSGPEHDPVHASAMPHASGASRGPLRSAYGWSQSAAPGRAGSGVPASGPVVGPGLGDDAHAYPGGTFGTVDVQLMSMLRRLAYLGQLESGFRASGTPAEAMTSGIGTGSHDMPAAVNVIRAHREELRQASSGALDHMVIDVVGSLFDQILSDPKVPPQMARQIARLQVPVLRVALGDVTFFSSRRHPVRRFVNRVASLACAFEDFKEDPGRRFLARVSALVQEIVRGDFDQIEVYERQLSELEAFVANDGDDQTAEHGGAATLLAAKEGELRLQQRYVQQLAAALAPLSMPDFLRDFLSQVWSQAIVHVSRGDGDDAPRTVRLRRAARELVMSVQPKGTPAHRKAFLMALPQLMKDLNEGLDAIGWPDAAKKDFFGRLLPAHAESLKATAMSDLDYNLLVRQLDAIFQEPLPQADGASPGLTLPPIDAQAARPVFTPEEAQRVGLVDETRIDWDGKVDIEVGAEPELTEVDMNIDGLPAAEPPEPTHGAALIDHIQLGFAYQMHLSGQWQKVRLSHVSPGRAFFVFTHGRKHQFTVSMTARMVQRMCETGRLRSFENAYLIERATARARKQLAGLHGSARH
jgi:hypothetical protein